MLSHFPINSKIMKSKFPPIYLLFFLLLIAFSFLSHSSNPGGGLSGAPGENNCTQCHTGNNPNGYAGTLQIVNFPSSITPNTTYNLQAVINYTAGTPSRAGFQAVILKSDNTNAGDLTATSANTTTQLFANKKYIEHNPALFFGTNNSVTYTFDWLSPEVPNGEVITLYTAGVIADGFWFDNDLVVTNSYSGTVTTGGGNPPTATASSTPVSCFGGSNGTATATGTGGNPGYNYLWSNGGNTISISGLMAGTYTVTITDNAGGTASATTVVSQPNSPVLATITNQNNPSCNGSNNGFATASGSGGTSGYSFSWSNGNNNATINNLTSGTYTVTIFDNNQCTSTTSVNITEPNAISISASQNNISCNGNNDGSATANPSGGSGNFSYNWSNGANTQIIINLAAGIYTVTVFDSNQCSNTASIIIDEPTPISPTFTGTPPDCVGNNNGTMTCIVGGGTPPFTYNWFNGATSQTITGTGYGIFSCTITDAIGCTATESISVDPPFIPFLANASATDVTTNGANDGTATANPSGGIGNYTFLWTNNMTTSTINNLSPGNYTVTVTDDNGCTTTQTVTVAAFGCTLEVNVTGQAASCANATDGSATATATGGSSQYTYNWSNGQTGMTISNLAPGTYTVTVSDTNNCAVPEEVTIGVADTILPTVLTQNTDAYLDADGNVDITSDMIDGGSSDNCGIQSMTVSQTAFSCDDLGTQTVMLTVTDVNGNIGTNTATVNILDTIPPTSNCAFNPTVNPCTGFLVYELPTFNDNCAGISFEIIGPQSGSILPIGTSTIEFIITDGSGNTISCSIDVINDSQLSIDIVGTDVLCFGENSGSAIANVTGSSSDFTYLWNTGDTTQQINNLLPGLYNVVVTDSLGCDAFSEISINEPNELVVTVITIIDESAPGQSDGAIELNTSGGIPPYTYTPNPTNLPSGTYVIEITDANGCVISTQEIIVGTMVSNETILLEKNISLFPNPSSGKIYLGFSLEQSMEVGIKLFDVTGKMLQTRPSEFISQEEIELDVFDLTDGLYFIQIQVDEKIIMKRFILQKE